MQTVMIVVWALDDENHTKCDALYDIKVECRKDGSYTAETQKLIQKALDYAAKGHIVHIQKTLGL